MPELLEEFELKGWIRRFAAALEETAAGADHMGVSFEFHGTVKIDDYQREMHRRYLEMASLANTDAYAAKFFDESVSGSTPYPTACWICCGNTQPSHAHGPPDQRRCSISGVCWNTRPPTSSL